MCCNYMRYYIKNWDIKLVKRDFYIFYLNILKVVLFLNYPFFLSSTIFILHTYFQRICYHGSGEKEQDIPKTREFAVIKY